MPVSIRAVGLGPWLLVMTAFVVGCTVEADDSNPFGTAPVTSAPPMDATGDATMGGTSSGSGGSDPSSGGMLTTSGADASTGPELTTGDSASSSSGGGGDGTQPAMGMYSDCAVPEDCGFAPTLCITVNDAGGALLGGFCSETACVTPAVDCDPSPSGSVTPVCVPVTVNDVADTACALQCTGGASCPSPMECLNVTGLGEVCV